MSRTSRGFIAAALAATALAACGGKPEGCTPVSPDVAQAIVDGATGDLTIHGSTGKAIDSGTGVYFVAYKVRAAGQEEAAVWALSSISPPGAIRSVDGFASQFTKWPELANGNGSQPAADALACLN